MAKPQQVVKQKVQKVKKPSENTIECEAVVVEVLPNATFKVKLKDFDTDQFAILTPSGKMRKNHIKIIKGDHVKVLLSTYDLTKGRIAFRYKSAPVNYFKKDENKEN